MTANLSLYVTKEDYENVAGPDWPSYQDFLSGNRGVKREIQDEINGWIQIFQKDGIKFPIRTETSCQSKWTWSTIWLNKLSSSSCHRVNAVPFSLDQFDNFHNLPSKQRDRKLMLAGKWPGNGCEYCRDIEYAGGHSDRQHNLEIRNLTPPELETDPTAVVVTPRLVEIFAQNTCNMSCIYCHPDLSSKIAQENIKFGEFRANGVHIPVVKVPDTAHQYFEKFIGWLEKNIQVLRRLHLLGGETFLQHELMERVLSVIEKNPNPDLEFTIFSNMTVPDRYWNMYTQRIKYLQKMGCIKIFDLTASIDCWGAQQEYVRYGLDLNKFEQRFSWAADQDWLRLTVNQTITSMTIKTMPELIEKIKYYSQGRHIGHYFEMHIGPRFHHPGIFAWSMWEDDFKRILDAMPKDTDNHIEAIVRMQGVQKQLQASGSHDFNEIENLHIYLDEIDRRRGTDWRSLFPYLIV